MQTAKAALIDGCGRFRLQIGSIHDAKESTLPFRSFHLNDVHFVYYRMFAGGRAICRGLFQTSASNTAVLAG